MTVRGQLELEKLEDRTRFNPDTGHIETDYVFIKDPAVLTDNKDQVIKLAVAQEKRLKRQGRLTQYNDVLRDMLVREAMRPLSKEEEKGWQGLISDISHHAVLKPQSKSTPVRVVSNSSLDNNWSDHSYNSTLAKGPNSLTPLLEVLTTWRTYLKTVVWDLSKCTTRSLLPSSIIISGDSSGDGATKALRGRFIACPASISATTPRDLSSR